MRAATITLDTVPATALTAATIQRRSNRNQGGGCRTSSEGYEVPTGVQRILWKDSSAVGTDGLAKLEYPGVAVLDTGIALDHPDLEVAGGINCSTGKSYRDGNGHGTHVAGTIAAKGAIVGVAPGAPLYAVRVLNNAGSGSWSSIICGVDWATANTDKVQVANMSLGGSGAAGANCDASALRKAICTSVEAGVTYVAAAGNAASDAKDFVAAAYPEVITVAAMADFDGMAGGLSDPNRPCSAMCTACPFRVCMSVALVEDCTLMRRA